MLNVLKRLRPDPGEVHTQLDPDTASPADLLAGYQWHFDKVVARIGMPGARVRAAQAGHAPGSGLPVFFMSMRLDRWAGSKTAILLLGLPILEKAVRRELRTGWVLDASVFAGVWMHASADIEVPPVFIRSMREAIGSVPGASDGSPPGAAIGGAPAAGGSHASAPLH